MKRLLIATAFIVVTSGGIFAQALPPASAPYPVLNQDAQDVIFIQPEGALRFRFHVHVDGKAPSAKWAAFLDKIFTWYDRDQDKFLGATELNRLSNLSQLSQGFNFVFNGRPGGQQGPQIKDHDTNKDGKIDRTEFYALARKVGFAPLVVSIYPPNRQAEVLTDAFYKHVNLKNDGKLTKSDLAAAWNILRKLDHDEDELISNQELQQRPQQSYYAEEVQQAEYGGMPRTPQPQTPSPFIALPVSTPATVFPQLIQQLQLQKCTAPLVFGLPVAANLPKFVRDALQKIDHDALTAWLGQPPDLEFSIALGDLAEGIGRLVRLGQEAPGVVVLRPGGREPALAKAGKTGSDGVLRITLADARIELGKGFNQGRNFDGNATYYVDQYKQAAGEKKYLDKMSIQQNPFIQFLANLFDDADKNADGKLFVDELTAFFDLLKGGPSAQCYVTITDQGRALYAVMDENNNQSLSQRELLNFLAKFDANDRNRDAAIERTELLRQFRVVTSIGNSGGNLRAAAATGIMGVVAPAGSARGPAWFQKMDRNKDGDVSPREFLGAPAEFQKFDLNNDGLLSGAEAQKIEDARKTVSK